MRVRPGALLLVAIVWTGAVSVAPVSEWPAVRAAAGLVCHQLPERSFHVAAAPMAVCARCLGLYGGGLVGLALGMCLRTTRVSPARARALVGIAALPTIATLVAEWLAWWPVGNLTRFIAAIPLSTAAAFAVAAALASDRKSIPLQT